MRPRTRRRAAIALFGAVAVMFAFGVAVTLTVSPATSSEWGSAGTLGDVLFAATTFAFPLVGLVVATRQPANRIGWILLAIGLVWGVVAVSGGYARLALAHPGSVPRPDLVTALTSWLWVPGIGLVGTFLLLLFPDGRLPSRRWLPVPWLAAAAMVVVAPILILSPGSLADDGLPGYTNPLGVEALEPLVGGLQFLIVLIPLAVALSAWALIHRFRRSRGAERQQLKWLTAAGSIVAVGYLVAVTGSLLSGLARTTAPGWVRATQNIALLSLALIPVSIGIAVLKHRLYDVDLVIRKTVLFGALAAFFTAVYAGVVIGIGAIVGERANTPLTVAAAVIIALAFNPVRERARRFANRLVYGKRATPYEVLSEFADRMATTYSLDDVLPRLARLVTEGTGARRVGVWVLVGGELRREAMWPSDAEWPASLPGDVADVPGATRTVPVVHRGEALGLVAVEMPPREALTPTHEKLLDDVAAQAALVLRNVALVEDLRASRQRIVAAQDEERRRLERNIHDGAQQQLVALAVRLKLAERLAQKEAPKVAEMLEGIRAETTEALENLRDLARGIYPPLLADQGLASALSAQARKAPFPVRVEPNGIGRYPQEVEAAIYFCVLEALQNVAKYADASRVIVRLHRENREVVFDVEDDGRGFDPARTPKGMGVQNMTDRLDALGGSLDVSSSPGRGTRVTGRVPAMRELGS